MKNLLIGLFTIATTAAFGQIRRGNNVVIQPQFGVYGGLSVANQWVGDDYEGYSDKAKAGGIIGVQLALPISYGWYVQPEVSYSNMGAKEWDGATTNTQYNFNYLNVPILFKYQEPFTGLGIMFGPQYSYLLNAKMKYNDNGRQSFDIKDEYHTSDLGALVGLEYYFPNNGMPGPKFGLSLRYQFGILNINKNSNSYEDGSISDYQPNIRNNGFFLTAGIRF